MTVQWELVREGASVGSARGEMTTLQWHYDKEVTVKQLCHAVSLFVPPFALARCNCEGCAHNIMFFNFFSYYILFICLFFFDSTSRILILIELSSPLSFFCSTLFFVQSHCPLLHYQLLLIPYFYMIVCILFVCVWSAVGNGSVPVRPVVRLVHSIRAPLPPQHTMWRGFGEARCPTIAGSDYPW